MDDLFGSDSDHSTANQHKSHVPSDNEDLGSLNAIRDEEAPPKEVGLEGLFDDDEDEDDTAAQGTKNNTRVKNGVNDNISDNSQKENKDEGEIDDDSKLFGSDDDENNSGEELGLPPPASDAGEEEEDIEHVTIRWMNAQVPPHKRPQPADPKYILARWPNSLTLEARPFTPENYIDLLANEHDPNKLKSKGYKVPRDRIYQAYDTIRSAVLWRDVGDDENGNIRQQSNSRLIKWTDGSMTLLTGGGAHYEIKSESLSAPQPSLSKTTAKDTKTTESQKRYFYGLAHHPFEALMQTHFRFTDQWVLRPAAMESRPDSVINNKPGSRRTGSTAFFGGARARNFPPMRYGTGGVFATKKEEEEELEESKPKTGHIGTKVFFATDNPELQAKQAELEEQEREKGAQETREVALTPGNAKRG